MSAITVRNLPPELARVIRQKAKKEKASLNRTVISLLEKATGLVKPRAEEVHTDRTIDRPCHVPAVSPSRRFGARVSC